MFLLFHENEFGNLIHSMQKWYCNMMRLDVKSCLLYFLDILGEKEGVHFANRTTIEKRFNQEELAFLLFTSRQSIVRCLNELSAEGIVSFSRKSIELNGVGATSF